MDGRYTSPLIWIDMEMTGLDPKTCHVLEIATIVTDARLEILAEGPNIVIHQSEAVLEAMSEWCVKHHGASGLTDSVRASTTSLADAEDQTLAFLRAHAEPGMSPLCGNSVDLDHRFIERHMPRIASFLKREIVDVTTIKELTRRWLPNLKAPRKGDNHRALDDIRESIAELRFYREHAFRPAEGGLPTC